MDGIIQGYLKIIDVDTKYHLWTIKDAKDYDVLVANIHHWDIGGNTENFPIRVPTIFIYKEEKTDNKYIHARVSLFNNTTLNIYGNMYYIDEFGIKDIHPSTKEQRDLLFTKMKEEGYEWNTEKKEFRKIENSNYADVLNGLSKLTDEDIDNLNKVQSWYRCERIISAEEAQKLGNWLKLFYDKLSSFQKMKEKEIKKTSEWTKEDDELCQDALDAFEALANDLNPSEDWGKLYDWLKSLKQRMEKQQ